MVRTTSERLRRRLIAEMRAKGVLSSPRVKAAFLAVAREQFLPEALADGGLEEVYRDDAIATKRNDQGLPLSSSSQPSLMAKMLDLLSAEQLLSSGMIGDPDPYTAVINALELFRVDDIVISTLPDQRSGWLRANLLERVRSATSARVEHVVVDTQRSATSTPAV